MFMQRCPLVERPHLPRSVLWAVAGLLRIPGRSAPTTRWVAWPARRPAGWWSSGAHSAWTHDRGGSWLLWRSNPPRSWNSPGPGATQWSRRISHPGGLHPKSETDDMAIMEPRQLIVVWTAQL